jgi:hypothetical protein
VPSYDYRCPHCSYTFTLVCSADDPDKVDFDDRRVACTPCLRDNDIHPVPRLKRVWAFNKGPSFEPHVNGATGKYTTSMAQFRSDLARASEEATKRTGIPHNYQPIDRQEQVAMAREKYGDAGMKEQHDAAVARGERPPTGRTVL